jgi:hypothetical protein
MKAARFRRKLTVYILISFFKIFSSTDEAICMKISFTKMKKNTRLWSKLNHSFFLTDGSQNSIARSPQSIR